MKKMNRYDLNAMKELRKELLRMALEDLEEKREKKAYKRLQKKR